MTTFHLKHSHGCPVFDKAQQSQAVFGFDSAVDPRCELRRYQEQSTGSAIGYAVSGRQGTSASFKTGEMLLRMKSRKKGEV